MDSPPANTNRRATWRFIGAFAVSVLLLGVAVLTMNETVLFVPAICAAVLGMAFTLCLYVRLPRAACNTTKMHDLVLAFFLIVNCGIPCTLIGVLCLSGPSHAPRDEAVSNPRFILLMAVVTALGLAWTCCGLWQAIRILRAWRLRFSLRTLLTVPLLLGILLGVWLNFVKPRVDFAERREELLDQMRRQGVDLRGEALMAVLEPLTYDSFESPILARATLRNVPSVLLIDWVAPDPCVDGIDVLFPNEEVIRLPLSAEPALAAESATQEHVCVYMGRVDRRDWPDEFDRIWRADEVRVVLTSQGKRVSSVQKLETDITIVD